MNLSAKIDGTERFFGRLPRTAPAGRLFRSIGDVIPAIPEDQWHETDTSPLAWDLLDQNSYGACVACCATLALETARRQAGLPDVKLSWGNLYGQINGGRDQGALLSDAMIALTTVGVCDAATVPLEQWHQATWPANWRENARRYRATEVWDLPTINHAMTAAFEHWPVVYGIAVYENFLPDAEGFLPDPQGSILGLHAVPILGIHYARNQRWATSKNSWGNWGLNGTGLFYLPTSYLTDAVTDAWAPRVTTYAKPHGQRHDQRTA